MSVYTPGAIGGGGVGAAGLAVYPAIGAGTGAIPLNRFAGVGYNGKTSRHIIWSGDSTISGDTVPVANPCSTRLGQLLATQDRPELGPYIQGGFVGMWRTDQWTIGSTIQTGSLNGTVNDYAPFGYDARGSDAGGTDATHIITWTRPAGLTVAAIRVYLVQSAFFSNQISYSVNGGTTWNQLVAQYNPPNPALAAVDIITANPTTLQIRCATVAGANAILPGILGIVPMSVAGAIGRTVQDAATNSNTIVTSATANFVNAPWPAGDVGAPVTGLNIIDGTTIATWSSATAVVLNQAAIGTGTNGNLSIDTPSATGIMVHNLGRDANFLFSYARSTLGKPQAVPFNIRPDLHITGYWTNDGLTSTPAAYTQQLENLALTFLSNQNGYGSFCDTIMLAMLDQSGRSYGSAYRAAAQAAAQNAGIGVGYLDITQQWGLYAAANASGFMNDTLHPSQAGHNAIANQVARLIRVGA